MKTTKTNEELIIEKHVTNLHAGFKARAEREYPPSPAMGDFRWTEQLIISINYQAEHGRPPENGLEYRVGRSEGGFDVLDFKFLDEGEWTPEDVEIDLSIPLNKRGVGREIEIPIPIYSGGMSFGSISEEVMVSRARAAQKWGTFISTGEGGYPLLSVDGVAQEPSQIYRKIRPRAVRALMAEEKWVAHPK